jgi:hypothetical protein
MLPSANFLPFNVRNQIAGLEPALFANFHPAQPARIDLRDQRVTADAECLGCLALPDQ